ncbi:MAG: type IV pilus secretin PilQ [Pyrinomonadaceae bacterium]
MPAHFSLRAVITRSALAFLLLCLLNVLTFADTPTRPFATDVRVANSGASTLITIAGTAPMAYAVSHPDARTILIELPGVDASRLAATYAVSSPLIAGVSIEREHLTGAKQIAPCVRVNLLAPVLDRSQITDTNLVVELSPDTTQTTARPATTARPVPTPTPIIVTPRSMMPQTSSMTPTTAASSNTTQQTEQGLQYGQPGFVGEPADINVTNADIRDVLNYFTQQYGINFIIDSSVGAVPITINVSNVPWNIVLDSILQANRLGAQVNGNLLRIATSEVLAAEANIRQRIKEAQLDNSPLVTEFIRLNYARASGTLAQAAGSTGSFTGGVVLPTSIVSNGNGGLAVVGGGTRAVSGTGADEGILPIIQRRLSRRGGIEVDGRTNTLIVTDVRENIEAVRQLVALLDQPEPQVEIETRIVVATRNFSRDLGVLLSASVFNTGTGGNINASTTTALNAAAPTTVIGLTTGIFGTAQISAQITAAEAKGQAKVIATPRVTALNNRPAEIESSRQIPIITPQVGAGGSGAFLFTTTYVSVPLRLSVTPQITDAGTVIMRVVAENNTVDTTIVSAQGSPGISTQRMQTEVLVPDGGTTVIGGVLNDNESNNQTRTPGLGGLPVLGNLFKRNTVARQSQEILFFITPRIYRPDYQGRPTSGTVSNSTRSTTITQPVPLGNPTTNTPTQQQQQQQNVQPGLGVLPAPGSTLPTSQPTTSNSTRP